MVVSVAFDIGAAIFSINFAYDGRCGPFFCAFFCDFPRNNGLLIQARLQKLLLTLFGFLLS